MVDCTVIIPAWNANTTIERAISSIRQFTDAAILLVDDGSEDDTVAIAKRVEPSLSVIRHDTRKGAASARQTGLQACKTEFISWLDSDDFWLADRVNPHCTTLKQKSMDLVYTGGVLVSGETGNPIRDLPVPDFMVGRNRGTLLFERNWLPLLGGVICRTESARAIGGFDTGLGASEDYDFVLRSVAAGSSIYCTPICDYAYAQSTASLSRDIDIANQSVLTSLNKFSYEQIEEFYLRDEIERNTMVWGLVAVACKRNDVDAATCYLNQIDPHEPSDTWKLAFYRGVIACRINDTAAATQSFLAAQAIRSTPEALNNLGVLAALDGVTEDAMRYWKRALLDYPNYLDAQINLGNPSAHNLTATPLRTTHHNDRFS